MLRVQFEEDLEKLHNQFYAMGNEVLSQINRTVRAFVTHDRELARQVRAVIPAPFSNFLAM